MKKWFLWTALLLVAVCLLAYFFIPKRLGMDDYIETLQSGIETLGWPREMEVLFGDADHSITHYGFSSEPRQWNSDVYIYGRYTLALTVEVNVDYKHNKIAGAASSPKFYLCRVSEIVEGGKGANFAGQWILDEAKWRQLVQAGGDFSAIGIPIETNNPVGGFDAYVRGYHAMHVKIPRKLNPTPKAQ